MSWWDKDPAVQTASTVAPPQASGNWWEKDPPAPRAWADVPGEALNNLVPSAVNFGKAVAQPFIHPVDTANSLLDIGKGVVSKIAAVQPQFDASGLPMAPQETPEEKADRDRVEGPANAVGQFFKDRYGSLEGIKNTLATDPVGAAADLATVLSGGAGIAGRAPGLLGETARAAGTAGALADPLAVGGYLLKGAGKVGEPIASNALGLVTGTGAESLRNNARAGVEGNPVFRENMRGNVPMTDVVDMAQSGLDKVRQDRGAAYRKGMGEVGQDTTVLDFQPIEDALFKAHDVGTFKGQVVNESAGNVMDKITKIVGDWQGLDPKEFHTAEGLDALKRKIGDLRDSTQYGTPERVAADRVYNAVKDEVAKQAPKYAETMKGYADASDQLKDLTRTFSLKEGTSVDTTLRKLQSIMRNNVQTNYGERLKLADVLAAKEPDLKAAIAGQAMNSLVPRGLVARGAGMGAGYGAAHMLDPTLLGAMLASSPRLVGELVHGGARAVGGTQDLAKALGVTGPRLRAAELAAFQSGRKER